MYDEYVGFFLFSEIVKSGNSVTSSNCRDENCVHTHTHAYILVSVGDDVYRLTNRTQIKGGGGGGGVDGFGVVGSSNDKRPFNRRPSRPRGRPYSAYCTTIMAEGWTGGLSIIAAFVDASGETVLVIVRYVLRIRGVRASCYEIYTVC